MSIPLIEYVTNAAPQSGVGHQAWEIARRLEERNEIQLTRWHVDGESGQLLRNGELHTKIESWPGMLGAKSVNWIRLGRRLGAAGPVAPALLRSEELRKGEAPRLPREATRGEVGSRHPRAWHFTNQTLSFLAKKLSPSVVTVHDIIELLEPQDKRAYWLNRYLYSGLRKANHLICVSEYTKQTVQEHLNMPAEKITVIHNGVGTQFHPWYPAEDVVSKFESFETTIAYQELLREVGVSDEAKVVLYVGSDHPRKNVITAIRAFAKVKSELKVPLVFLKVGAAGSSAGRAQLLDEIDNLNLRDSVRVIDSVPKRRLNDLYNLADVFVFPSRYEGFGLPVLQAMAAGTPVITSNTTSLPEVAGNAGLMHDPDDVQTLANYIQQVLSDEALANELRLKGFQRAYMFSWETAAQQTFEVYQRALAA